MTKAVIGLWWCAITACFPLRRRAGGQYIPLLLLPVLLLLVCAGHVSVVAT